ncbi:MAG: DAK2 domain-containing protein [Clostridia bacterium]|nr:DAK2 domain-containing protein [Clostridia bacterium]
MKVLTTTQLRDMLKGGALNLEINKAYVDSLNVFPVPDGDTGTNMNLTMQSSIKMMEDCTEDDIGAISQAFAKGALMGARGNSGVILSQIFKGFSAILKESKELTTKVFARALKNGSHIAYDVVTSPKEGTILTVIRLVSDYALKIAGKKQTFINFFEAILAEGEKVLSKSPEMLPVLKKAGVVDAGGRGLLCILYGMYNVLAGKEMVAEVVPETDTATNVAEDKVAHEFENLDDIKYAYCTEFFIINIFQKTTLSDIDKLRDKLQKIGDSLIVVGDLDFVKVHVHTNNPDKALGYALQLGELGQLKIENMLEQNREINRKKKEIEKVPPKPVGLVSICTGEGISTLFKELRADAILEGGQTMNPSVDDIVKLVDGVNAETVYILPNNGNIVLAAEQAKELTKANLVVIATKNIPQGISAAMNFDPSLDVETNVSNMETAMKQVRSGQITHAVRDTEMDGIELHNGDVIGLYEKTIVASGQDVNEVAKTVIEKMADDSTAAITLYYGAGLTENVARALEEELIDIYPFHDIIVCEGGQHHYFYFISVE